MQAVTGAGMSGFPVRPALPMHDPTGGDSRASNAILYQSMRKILRPGGGRRDVRFPAIGAGTLRAQRQL